MLATQQFPSIAHAIDYARANEDKIELIQFMPVSSTREGNVLMIYRTRTVFDPWKQDEFEKVRKAFLSNALVSGKHNQIIVSQVVLQQLLNYYKTL